MVACPCESTPVLPINGVVDALVIDGGDVLHRERVPGKSKAGLLEDARRHGRIVETDSGQKTNRAKHVPLRRELSRLKSVCPSTSVTVLYRPDVLDGPDE